MRKVVNKITETLCIVILAVMVLLVLWQIFARYVLNSPSSFSEALAKDLFVWLVIVSATYAFGSREHMRISILPDKLKGAKSKALETVIDIITIVFAGLVMAFGGIIITKEQMVEIDSSLHIPTGVLYMIIPICGCIIILYTICCLKDRFSGSGESTKEKEA